MTYRDSTFTYILDENCSIEVDLDPKVFRPTGTSEILIESVLEFLTKPGKLLDLGCGSGLVGLAIYKGGKVQDKLYASDLSNEAVNLLKKNAVKNEVLFDVRQGSIYEPWSGQKFDYIIDDISGVAKQVASISSWFSKTSCEAGIDGTSLVNLAIKGAPKHLNKRGLFFFPVLSLSNSKKIIEVAKSVFNNVEKINSKTWALPDDMKDNLNILLDLKKEGHVNFDEKFGLILWSTDIYVAYNPK
jgi:release factor glutamine methyltransferase